MLNSNFLSSVSPIRLLRIHIEILTPWNIFYAQDYLCWFLNHMCQIRYTHLTQYLLIFHAIDHHTEDSTLSKRELLIIIHIKSNFLLPLVYFYSIYAKKSMSSVTSKSGMSMIIRSMTISWPLRKTISLINIELL